MSNAADLEAREVVCGCGHPEHAHADDGCGSCFCRDTAAMVRHDAGARTAATPEPHDAEVGHSGDFVRIECSCGWLGDWRHKNMPTRGKALRSDHSTHTFQTKRKEAEQ